MSGAERNRIDQMIGTKERGDRVGNSMYWDPHSKRICYGNRRDPDSPCLEATQSDLGHA